MSNCAPTERTPTAGYRGSASREGIIRSVRLRMRSSATGESVQCGRGSSYKATEPRVGEFSRA